MSDININITEKVAQDIASAVTPEDIRRVMHEAAISQGLAREVQVSGASGQVADGSIVLAPLPVRPKNPVANGNFESDVDVMIAKRMKEVTGHAY